MAYLGTEIWNTAELLWADGEKRAERRVFRLETEDETLLFFYYPQPAASNIAEILMHWAINEIASSEGGDRWLLKPRDIVLFMGELEPKGFGSGLMSYAPTPWVYGNLKHFEQHVFIVGPDALDILDHISGSDPRYLHFYDDADFLFPGSIGIGIITEYAERLDTMKMTKKRRVSKRVAEGVYECYLRMVKCHFHHCNLNVKCFGYDPNNGEVLMGLDDIRCFARGLDPSIGKSIFESMSPPRNGVCYEDLEHILMDISEQSFTVANERHALARTLIRVICGHEISGRPFVTRSSPIFEHLDHFLIGVRSGNDLKVDSTRLERALDNFLLVLILARAPTQTVSRYANISCHLASVVGEEWSELDNPDDPDEYPYSMKARIDEAKGTGILYRYFAPLEIFRFHVYSLRNIKSLMMAASAYFKGSGVTFETFLRSYGPISEDVLEACLRGFEYDEFAGGASTVKRMRKDSTASSSSASSDWQPIFEDSE